MSIWNQLFQASRLKCKYLYKCSTKIVYAPTKNRNGSRAGLAQCGEVIPTCAKRSWVRTSLSALHFAGVRLGSYNPSPDPTLCRSFYALGMSSKNGNGSCFVWSHGSSNTKPILIPTRMPVAHAWRHPWLQDHADAHTSSVAMLIGSIHHVQLYPMK
jgi:hypothetical protein